MTRIRLGMARIGTLIGALLFGAWSLSQQAVMLIGASTVVDDYNQLVERLPAGLEWLFTTPWWVPSGLAAILTAFLIWLSWPQQHVVASGETTPEPPPPENEIRPTEEAPSATRIDRCFCDVVFDEQGSVRISEHWNLHDVFVTKLEDDVQFHVSFAIPFLPRVISVVAVEHDGKRTDLLSTSRLSHHTERYCIIRVGGMPTPCVVRVLTVGGALPVAAQSV